VHNSNQSISYKPRTDVISDVQCKTQAKT